MPVAAKITLDIAGATSVAFRAGLDRALRDDGCCSLAYVAQWRYSGQSQRTEFLIQLAFNALWSWLFFARNLGAWAFADIVLFWVLIITTLVSFWRVSKPAGAGLIPYLLWVTFAGASNHAL